MNEDQDPKSMIDAITQLAIRQSSRRGFIRWVAKVGLAAAAAAGGGLAFISTAFAHYDCSKLPGCSQGCGCFSCCEDPDSGYQCCNGCCNDCAPSYSVEITVFYYWDPGLNHCVMVKDCTVC